MVSVNRCISDSQVRIATNVLLGVNDSPSAVFDIVNDPYIDCIPLRVDSADLAKQESIRFLRRLRTNRCDWEWLVRPGNFAINTPPVVFGHGFIANHHVSCNMPFTITDNFVSVWRKEVVALRRGATFRL